MTNQIVFTHTLEFPIVAIPGAVLSFPCDESGWVDEEAIHYHIWQTLQDCLAGRHLGYEIGAPAIVSHPHANYPFFFRVTN